MVAVACQDILMRENTTIGCSAPITMGDKLEGAEREKIESFLRAAFSRAAQANGYPEALLKAMVSSQIEVYQVLNKKTSQYEYFEKEFLPKDEKTYDLAGRQLVDKEGELLTLTDKKALEYGIARAVVQDLDAALEFLEKRDNVRFDRPVVKMETNWSEEMVRWLNSPVVAGILVMGILLGIYVELNTPGIGLPSLLAIVCLVILVGSKYLIGLANWVEMAILLIGLILLAVELFVLPGFGIAGITGILCIMASLFGMLIKNPPGKVPWPETQLDWQLFDNGILAVFLGAAGFVILAWLFSKYLPKIPVAKKLILASPVETDAVQYGMASEKPLVEIAQKGITLGQLRPCGVAQFGRERVNVISRGEFIDENKEIIVESIEGNNIVVKEIS
jgi:membrane-bound serine protease (ClpP class)